MRPGMIEVRCCCRPQKLLGWVPVAYTSNGVARMRLSSSDAILELPVQAYHSPDTRSETFTFITRLAVKSEETPLEVLRLVRGFEENTTREM